MERYRKGIIAVLTALAAIGTQLLGTGVMSPGVAQVVTVVIAVIGAVLTVLVPNAPQVPKSGPAQVERPVL